MRKENNKKFTSILPGAVLEPPVNILLYYPMLAWGGGEADYRRLQALWEPSTEQEGTWYDAEISAIRGNERNGRTGRKNIWEQGNGKPYFSMVRQFYCLAESSAFLQENQKRKEKFHAAEQMAQQSERAEYEIKCKKQAEENRWTANIFPYKNRGQNYKAVSVAEQMEIEHTPSCLQQTIGNRNLYTLERKAEKSIINRAFLQRYGEIAERKQKEGRAFFIEGTAEYTARAENGQWDFQSRYRQQQSSFRKRAYREQEKGFSIYWREKMAQEREERKETAVFLDKNPAAAENRKLCFMESLEGGWKNRERQKERLQEAYKEPLWVSGPVLSPVMSGPYIQKENGLTKEKNKEILQGRSLTEQKKQTGCEQMQVNIHNTITVREEMDADKIVRRVADGIAQSLSAAAEGVYF